jgi:hypothetical protein
MASEADGTAPVDDEYSREGVKHSINARSPANLAGLHVKCLLHYSGILA